MKSSFVSNFRPFRFTDGYGVVTPTSDTDFAGMCRGLGVDGKSALEALRHYIDDTLGRPPRSSFPGVAKLRREALGMMVVQS